MGVIKGDARSLDHGSYGVFQKGRLVVCVLFLVPSALRSAHRYLR